MKLVGAYKDLANEIKLKLLDLYNKLQQDQVLNSHRYEYDKLYKLYAEINDLLKKFNVYERDVVTQQLENLYIQNTQIVANHINHSFTQPLNKDMIKDIINEYWVGDGLNVSSRIWKNKQQLAQELEKSISLITSGVISPDEAIKKIMPEVDKSIGKSYNCARRLVRTELKRIEMQSTIDEYKRGGIKEYRFITNPHDKQESPCSKVCRELKDRIFNVDDAKCGINLPPIHCNCVCSIIPIIPITTESIDDLLKQINNLQQES